MEQNLADSTLPKGWEMVIGLEVHAQVTSKAKLFSGSSTEFGAEPNSQVSFVDAAMPGMLPVINRYCVEQAVKTGLGLHSTVNLTSVFDRKNYFYADLPQGYQISQFTHPIVSGGEIWIDTAKGEKKKIRVTRLHLEQDAGKLLHDQHPSKSQVDLNRSGIALMEIVSEPDMQNPDEAAAYLKQIRALVRWLGTCDGNMEEGSLRCDANVSVRRKGEPLGTRCEIKNVNSIRYVAQAIQYEAERQIDLIEGGGTVRQETRLFDAARGETRTMRSKEEAHDYRYFPDPDLPPLVLEAAWVEGLRGTLPELPDDRAKRYVRDLGLSTYDADVLVADKENSDYYEVLVGGGAKPRDAKICANWVTGDLFAALNKLGVGIGESPISAARLGELIDLIGDGTISGKIAKEIFAAMLESPDQSPAAIVDARGLRQVSDTGPILAAIDAIMEANPDKVAEYRGGKDKLFGFFVGQVMKATGGKANPTMLNDLLKQKLG
ncbi:MAG: Asp-tRNA(Asn)/Glu-tRNA(Gln) amidotransferase subunit GatB [Alphaproteobacteria bacterium]|nr:Asp-tRNA(Asn)/Glu-tRNA(Gln) amidotransferase subunit GatB [Alphaproteobacteria bacterium]